MKNAGYAMLAIGGLMLLSGINLMFTEYDLSNSHDLSKGLGALGVSAAIAAVGAYLAFKKEKRR